MGARRGNLKIIISLSLGTILVILGFENCGHLGDGGSPLTSQNQNSQSLSVATPTPVPTATPTPTPTPGPIAMIQRSFSNKPAGSMTAQSDTMYLAQNAGDLNIVVIGWNDGTSLVTSVTDTSGNIYTAANGKRSYTNANPALDLTQVIYYAQNINAAAAGKNVVSVTLSAAVPNLELRVMEFSGFGSPVKIISKGGNIGSTTTPITPAVTSSAVNQLIFAADTSLVRTSTGDVGYVVDTSNSFGDIIEFQVINGIGSYTPSATLTSSSGWVMQAIIFSN